MRPLFVQVLIQLIAYSLSHVMYTGICFEMRKSNSNLIVETVYTQWHSVTITLTTTGLFWPNPIKQMYEKLQSNKIFQAMHFFFNVWLINSRHFHHIPVLKAICQSSLHRTSAMTLSQPHVFLTKVCLLSSRLPWNQSSVHNGRHDTMASGMATYQESIIVQKSVCWRLVALLYTHILLIW